MSKSSEQFSLLYDQIQIVMDQYTESKSIPLGLYDIHPGNNGRQIGMYVAHMEYIREPLVRQLQNLLTNFPNREIIFTVTCPEDVDKWPLMGLYIRKDDISDGLLRQYFPPEYQSITYEGSHPGDRYDTIVFEGLPTGFKPLYRRVDGVLGAAAKARGLWSSAYDVLIDHADLRGLVIAAEVGLMQPDVIAALQGVLRDFPDWMLLVTPDDALENERRLMFVEVHHDEIVDRLDRSRLPRDYANLHYPGARRAKPMRIPASLLR